ncbi:HAD family hydrolase [Winogradskyella ursingii]|uniref:HAD family hydrolase n=1 Tax=Winogradskyella ursingii TaxID=2686079 RepID=UPI0015C6CB69|nr:HAD family hydrolase [Winogradskyella ursingii]
MNQLRKKLENPSIKVLFTDYYDTLVHRSVHPNQVLRIWSKIIINELGLNISIDTLYFAFKESVLYLVEKLNTDRNELPYDDIKNDVFKRINTIGLISDEKEKDFLSYFEKAHLKAEKSVQRLNPNTLQIIKDFKAKGGKVYLLSDFYCPKSLFVNLLEHHGISELFDGVYSSSTVGKSKHTGTVYQHVLSELGIDPSNAIMIGDNERSDSKNAEKVGLHSYVLPHKKYLRQNKLNGFGDDEYNLRQIIGETYSHCNKKVTIPYTEYVVFYHFFVERLYRHCKKNDIKSLFFLSREGLFIKRLFDSYLKHTEIDSANTIRTHYLKVSRQASLQISLKPIEEERFSYLTRKYKAMSVMEFLSFLNFKTVTKQTIINALNVDGDSLVENFLDSEIFKNLKEEENFREAYETHRLSNKSVFTEYLNSFNEDIENDGINVVDIGWGGTMQEAIYNFFNQKIKVNGFYLGLNLIYSPNKDTKRHGFVFSILPYETYSFHILHANTQLYEQFAGAGHGCCIEYAKSENGYTIEHHEENEKWLYDNFIGQHQDEMFAIHLKLTEELETVCYNDHMVQNTLVDFALRVGTRQSMKKIKFLETLTAGYYQNISNKKTGIDYEIPKNLMSVKSMIKFILKPEEFFRYIVKVKHRIYKSNKVAAYLFPSFLIYEYYKFNKYMRYKVLRRISLLKYNYFR